MIITTADANQLADIVALETIGFDAQEQWSEAAWAEELDSSERYVLTRLDADNRVIAVATFSCVEGMADLLRVIVHPEARGKGVGASLVRAGLDWASAVGGRRMLLEVRPDNAAAVSLYRNLGFEQVSLRRDYYGPGRDALVMLRDIEHEDDWAVGLEWSDEPAVACA